MRIQVYKGLPPSIENSLIYPRLRKELHAEIINFCREKLELKEELNILRTAIGSMVSVDFMRNYMDDLKEKFNSQENIAIEYFIEQTRFDFSICVFCVIKRTDIEVKKFVFRYKKGVNDGLGTDVSNGGLPIDNMSPEEILKDVFGKYIDNE